MFVHGTIYTSSVSAAMMKPVRCEKCGGAYSYRMVRRGVGQGSTIYGIDSQGASDRSAANAQAKLHRLLQTGVDPVPCPHCGWLQREMVDEIHRRNYGWIKRLGWKIFLPFLP